MITARLALLREFFLRPNPKLAIFRKLRRLRFIALTAAALKVSPLQDIQNGCEVPHLRCHPPRTRFTRPERGRLIAVRRKLVYEGSELSPAEASSEIESPVSPVASEVEFDGLPVLFEELAEAQYSPKVTLDCSCHLSRMNFNCP